MTPREEAKTALLAEIEGPEFEQTWAYNFIREGAPDLQPADVQAIIAECRADWGKPKPQAPIAETPPPTAPTKAIEPRPRSKQTPGQAAKAARKQHKLSVDIPSKFTARVASSDWRRFPGMPDILVNRDGTAVQHQVSRRRGEYYKILALKFHYGKPLWVHWKDGIRTYIPVLRAMYETGFWKRPSQPSRDDAG